MTERATAHGRIDPFEAGLPSKPYPGLRPFQNKEWPIFFGREPMIHRVIDLVIENKMVVVHGDSGCGKSSLVRAGVLVQLEQGYAATGGRWRTTALLPREDPLGNLAKALASVASGGDPDPSLSADLREILNGGRYAPETVATLLREGGDDHICILVDQFEELFGYDRHGSHADAACFVEFLTSLAGDPPPGLYTILTMRSEFLGNCARYKGFAETVNRTQYLLPRMEHPALMRAIREPATLYDGEVSPELAEHLIAETGGEQDQLPLIQHGLMWLWQQQTDPAPLREFGLADAGAPYRQDNVLADVTVPFRHATRSEEPVARPVHQGDDAATSGFYPDRRGPAWRLGLENYRSSGRCLTDLLSAHADRVMAEAADPPERKRIIEHLFRALTEINAEGHAVRRPQKFADLCKVTGGDEEALRDILDHFRAEGISFLSPYGDAPIEPGTLIDISHEALIRSWAKLADKKEGWLQREFNDGLIWRSLIVQAESFRRDPKSVLSPARTEELDPWLAAFPPDWSERYGGGWSDVQKLMGASREARDEEERRHREFQETKRREAEARAQRAEEAGRAAEAARQAAAMLAATEQELRAAQTRRTKVAFAAALVCLILTAIAMAGGFYALQQKERADLAAEQAQEQAKRADLAAEEAQEEARRADAAVIETKAGSYWNQLQLWGYPIERRDVATLWRLTQEDDTVLGEFVRQLANSPDLLARFGLKPQPIARAVGLTWPDQARQIITQSMADLASGQLDLKRMRAFVLVSHTRALVALAPWLDPATLESGTQEIADAINNLAATRPLTDQQLWALAEMVGAFAERFEWEPIEPARRRLREMIESAEPSGSAGLRGQAISRAIEVMAPFLEPEERSRAVQYLVPLLGQNTDSWAAEAAPRALTALLPKLDRSQSDTALGGMPPAIAKIAVEQSSGDSSYLLTLMQVPETLADKGDQAAVAAFGRALLDQLKLPNQPRQHAALAHASLALLPRLPAGPTAINRHVADTTALIPGTAALDLEQRLDPVQRSLLRESVRNETGEALSHAASSPDAEQRRRQAEAVLLRLRSAWNAEPSPDAASNPYRRAAQMRLLAVLAPSLTPDSAARATEKLAEILPTTQDHMILAAIARALAEMAPNLSDTDRDKAIEPAMDALAMTGSTEEAIAWAKAIAALLSSDPRAATAQIVEALKYPTATGTPTDILLEGLAKPWPEDFEKIAGKKLPDPDVLDWLRAHLPERYDLSDPPKPPPGLQTTPG